VPSLLVHGEAAIFQGSEWKKSLIEAGDADAELSR
jgi:hypothetical protein